MSWRFIAVRCARLVVTLLVSSFVIFSSLYLSPGNPIATLSGGKSLSPQAVATLEQRFHLNDPFLTRYVKWLGGVLHGDFGISIALRSEVSSLIAARIWTTLALVGYASLLILVIGIGLGLLGGLKTGWVDTGVLAVTAISAAIPAFVMAISLLMLFVATLEWFPGFGDGDGFLDTLWHLTLPAIALAVSSLAIVARITRSAIRAELNSEHVVTAVSRGIRRSAIVRRHVLRNAAIPIMTVSGVTIASMFAVSAVVERAFTINGLGAYLVKAATSKDFAVVQGISLVIVAVFVVINTLVDVLYAVLDPRSRRGGTR
ncbi:MAG: ABC transporter permease [Ilumatobacteraceae bacterium]